MTPYLANDLLHKLEDKFRMLKGKDGAGQQLRLFERELSVTLQDIFFREIAAEGSNFNLSGYILVQKHSILVYVTFYSIISIY